MVDHFSDRLLDRCAQMGAPICVGIDPVYERLPRSLRQASADAGRIPGAVPRVEAIRQFVIGVLEAVVAHVPCVKFQSACFERYLWPGVEAYHRLVAKARSMGFIVIADVKRGDIGISSEHYAAAMLADHSFETVERLRGPDAMTINAYLGPDSIEPFVGLARDQGKGVFALVRTSNPGSDTIQSLALSNGTKVSDAVASMVAKLGCESGMVGKQGYSLLGAVVGATKVDELTYLRELMPDQIMLLPGLGAQGATPEQVRPCFRDGRGAIVTASRSILYAYEQSDGDWQKQIEKAAIALKQQVAAVLSSGNRPRHRRSTVSDRERKG